MKAACHSSRKYPLAIIATFIIVLGIKNYSTFYIAESSDNQLMYKVHNKNQVSCKL